MYNPDEKDIDRLSREAAEHYHAPGKPAWDALQQLLDKELPQEKEKKRRGFFFFFLLFLGFLLVGGTTWYGVRFVTSNKTTRAANTLTAKDKILPANKSVAPADKHTDDMNSSTAAASTATVLPTGSALPATGGTNATAVALPNEQNKLHNNGAPKNNLLLTVSPNTKTLLNDHDHHRPSSTLTEAGNKLAVRDENKNAYSGNYKRLVKNNQQNNTVTGSQEKIIAGGVQALVSNNHPPATAKVRNKKSTHGTVADGRAGLKNKNNSSDAVATTEPAGDADPIAATTLTEKDKTTDIAPNDAVNKNDKRVPALADTQTVALAVLPAGEKKDSSKPAVKKSASKKQRGLNIGLTAGADFSTVRFTHGDNAGYNIGLTGGYQFNKHWSVYTGVIYTKKNYLLNGSDYHPPKHYWTTYVKLETVDGYCRMWEVPLLARYTFNPGSKTVFFASAGLSSYFMKKQQYNYFYKNNMNQLVTTPWSNDSSFNHVFSILHLSAGFEKSLGKHMNWQVEPYAKIPLGGVGFGNIRLSSFGINFSVQYRKTLKR